MIIVPTYSRTNVLFKEQLSIARATFELELSVKIEEFYEASGQQLPEERRVR